MTTHLAIRDAIVNLLTAATSLAGGRIYPNRNYTLATGVDSQVNVHRVQSQPTRGPIYTNAPIDWATDMRVVVTARKQAALSAEAGADAIAVAAIGRILADQTLAGTVDAIEPGLLTWDQDENESNVVQITWDFQVMHRTNNNVIS